MLWEKFQLNHLVNPLSTWNIIIFIHLENKQVYVLYQIKFQNFLTVVVTQFGIS